MGTTTGIASYLLTSSQKNMSKLAGQLEVFLRLKLGDDVSLTGTLKRLEGGFDTDTFAFDGIYTVVENFPLNRAHKWALVSPGGRNFTSPINVFRDGLLAAIHPDTRQGS